MVGANCDAIRTTNARRPDDPDRVLEIRLLGPFEAAVCGHPVEVSGSKRHALFALLALRRGRVVGVDELVDA